MTKSLALLTALAVTTALTSCAKREEILQGTRFDTRVPLEATKPDEDGRVMAVAAAGNLSAPISLPAPVSLGTWTNRGASASHDLPHLSLSSAPKLVFAAAIGAGNDRKHRITSDPVVADGRIFTLDAEALVTATGTNGATLWSTDLTPPSDKPGEVSGGGVAYGDGKVFAATGYGTLSALDPASGKVVWTQRIEGVSAASPTVANGLVYVVARNGSAFALRTSDGRIAWEVSGPVTGALANGGSGVAIGSQHAILPFGSGRLLGVLKQTGVTAWEAILDGQRRGRASAIVGGLAGDPVIRGDTFYAGVASGRLIAADVSSGERFWTANEGIFSTPVIAGGSVFLMSDILELVRLDASTGQRIWGISLPDYVKPNPLKKRKEVFAHYGPLLAGGRLVVASNDGVIRFFSPESGALVGQVELPGGAASNPIVVGGTLYIVNQNGQLLAFR